MIVRKERPWPGQDGKSTCATFSSNAQKLGHDPVYVLHGPGSKKCFVTWRDGRHMGVEEVEAMRDLLGAASAYMRRQEQKYKDGTYGPGISIRT